MDPESDAVWQVTIEDTPYELTTDERTGLHLTEVYSGPAEALDHPYDALFAEKDEQA